MKLLSKNSYCISRNCNRPRNFKTKLVIIWWGKVKHQKIFYILCLYRSIYFVVHSNACYISCQSTTVFYITATLAALTHYHYYIFRLYSSLPYRFQHLNSAAIKISYSSYHKTVIFIRLPSMIAVYSVWLVATEYA